MDTLVLATFVINNITSVWHGQWQETLHEHMLSPLQSIIDRYHDYRREVQNQFRAPHIVLVENLVREISFEGVNINLSAGTEVVAVNRFTGTEDEANLARERIRERLDAILPLGTRYTIDLSRTP